LKPGEKEHANKTFLHNLQLKDRLDIARIHRCQRALTSFTIGLSDAYRQFAGQA